MKHYYIPSLKSGLEEVSESEYSSIIGDEQHRVYIDKLYNETITINEVPEEMRNTVQNIVNNRKSKYGSYDSKPATTKDVNMLIKALIGSNLTKKEIKLLLSSLMLLRENATDEIASRTINAFPILKEDGSLIKAGTRIRWCGVLKRAAVDLWDTVENNPDDAPELWEDIIYRDGYRIIPEIITVGLAFSEGELGWWNNKLYKSLLNSNVHTPEQYPYGWEEIEV